MGWIDTKSELLETISRSGIAVHALMILKIELASERFKQEKKIEKFIR